MVNHQYSTLLHPGHHHQLAQPYPDSQYHAEEFPRVFSGNTTLTILDLYLIKRYRLWISDEVEIECVLPHLTAFRIAAVEKTDQTAIPDSQ